jgi:predicted enzyme involved in methoxymalonyl-ACP biosynthesis
MLIWNKSMIENTKLPSNWFQTMPSMAQVRKYFDTDNYKIACERFHEWGKNEFSKKHLWSKNQQFHVSICGFSTLNYIQDHIAWAILSEGFIPNIKVGGYNQLYQDLSRNDGDIIQESTDLLLVLVDLFDLLPVEMTGDYQELLSPSGLQAVQLAVREFVSLLKTTRSFSKSFLLVNNFYPTRRSPFGIADSNREVSFEQIYNTANETLEKELKSVSYVGIFSLDYLIRKFGLSTASDPRMKYLVDCRFTDAFYFEIARRDRKSVV